PVTAAITAKAENFTWSSYQDYISTNPRYKWLHRDAVLIQFDNNHQHYRQYVENGVDEETYDFFTQKTTSVIFGDELFREKLLSGLAPETIKASNPDYNRVKKLPSLNEINYVCANFFGVSATNLSCRKRYK